MDILTPADQQILQRAIASLQSGALDEAERGFAEFLRRNPKHFGALNLFGMLLTRLARYGEAERVMRRAIDVDARSDATFYNFGVVLKALNRPLEALDAFAKAIAINSSVAESWNNRGTVLNDLKRYRDAIDDFDKAISINSNYPDAFCNKGKALAELKLYDQSLAAYDRALTLNPNLAEAWYGRGNILTELKRYDDALAAYDRALTFKPDLAGAWLGRGNMLTELKRYNDALAAYDRALAIEPDLAGAWLGRGNIFAELKQYDDALAANNKALTIEPDLAGAWLGRGNILTELKRYDDAFAAYDKALAIEPDLAGAWLGRGNALRELRRLEEALVSIEKALEIRPDLADAHYNRSVVLFTMDRLEEALAGVDRALALEPDAPKANWTKSELCLSLGRLAEGWDLHEYRWTGGTPASRRDYPQPRWNGDPINGVLLVWCEQGLGDQILHAGAVPELIGRASKVVLEVEPRLVPLFARSFREIEVVAAKPAPELFAGHVEAQMPIGDLGRFFRRSWDAFPRRERGYLVADPTRVRELRHRIARNGHAVIGLSWISRRETIGDIKSARLRELEPVLQLPGFRFIDLQYGDTSEERDTLARDLGIQVERLADIDNTADIDGLSALITACDAVVTVSNTTAHLAGALGIPTWVMVPYGHAGLWYWFRGHEKSPWYPHVRVIRKNIRQSWTNLAQIVADEVCDFARDSSRTS